MTKELIELAKRQAMTEQFDAVLAKPPIPDTYSSTEVTLRHSQDTKWVRREDFDWHMKQQADRLATAHAAALEAAERDARRKCADAVPSNWCDPLLTGPNAVLRGNGGTWGCPDIERLLTAIKARIDACMGEKGENHE